MTQDWVSKSSGSGGAQDSLVSEPGELRGPAARSVHPPPDGRPPPPPVPAAEEARQDQADQAPQQQSSESAVREPQYCSDCRKMECKHWLARTCNVTKCKYCHCRVGDAGPGTKSKRPQKRGQLHTELHDNDALASASSDPEARTIRGQRAEQEAAAGAQVKVQPAQTHKGFIATWCVPEKKVTETSDTHVTSQQFSAPIDGKERKLQLVIYPNPSNSNDRRGGQGFKKAQGRNRIEVKSAQREGDAVRITVSVGVGEMRMSGEPEAHDFASNNVFKPSVEYWDFKRLADSGTVLITVEVQPAPEVRTPSSSEPMKVDVTSLAGLGDNTRVPPAGAPPGLPDPPGLTSPAQVRPPGVQSQRQPPEPQRGYTYAGHETGHHYGNLAPLGAYHPGPPAPFFNPMAPFGSWGVPPNYAFNYANVDWGQPSRYPTWPPYDGGQAGGDGDAGAGTNIVVQELHPKAFVRDEVERPMSLDCAMDRDPPDDGPLTRVTEFWSLPGKKLDTHNKHEVSNSFYVPTPDQEMNPSKEERVSGTRFQLSIHPTPVNEGRHGSGFKKAKGKGRVELKCMDKLSEDFPILYVRIGVGKGDKGKPCTKQREHDFRTHNVFVATNEAGQDGDDQWDFKGAVDDATGTLTIIAEITFAPMEGDPMDLARRAGQTRQQTAQNPPPQADAASPVHAGTDQ